MKISRVFTLCLLFILSFKLSFADDIAGKLDELMTSCQKDDIFSGTILAAKDGRIIYEKSFGYADKESGKLNENGTKYNIGSIGKFFTKIIILQLLEEGKLDFNDKLSKYFDFFPADYSDKVTIAELLNMQAGFNDYLINPEYRRNINSYKNTMDLVRLIAKEKLVFEPGTDRQYSNSGYATLGGIIEKITGKDYVTNLKERILDRLGMTSTDFIYRDSKDPMKSTGYMKQIDGTLMSNENVPMQPSPAGGMFSTVEDMLKLDESIKNDNKLLKDETKVKLIGDAGIVRTESWDEMKKNPKFGAIIAGGAEGINAIYGFFPPLGYTYFILANYDQAANAIEPSITAIIKSKEVPKPHLPLGIMLYKVVKNEGAEHLKKNFDAILQSEKYEIREDGILNEIGYQFMQKNMLDAAIVIFAKNIDLFPNIANCYDSYAEAQMNAGNMDEAKKNYQKVLEMLPNNENAKKMLEKINQKN